MTKKLLHHSDIFENTSTFFFYTFNRSPPLGYEVENQNHLLSKKNTSLLQQDDATAASLTQFTKLI